MHHYAGSITGSALPPLLHGFVILTTRSASVYVWPGLLLSWLLEQQRLPSRPLHAPVLDGLPLLQLQVLQVLVPPATEKAVISCYVAVQLQLV